MTNPKLVLITDIHFTLSTLELATKALETAITKAKTLQVPLVICGDTLDSKAIIRGEIANRLINILSTLDGVKVYMLVGNHERLNEKERTHTLNFLSPYVTVVAEPTFFSELNATLIPYCSTTAEFCEAVSRAPSKLLIGHQGIHGANMGHYVQDKTSAPTSVLKNKFLISGHYHTKQDFENGCYLGNPYTLTYGEANDPAKGIHVLYSDNTLEFIALNLIKHVVINTTVKKLTMDLGVSNIKQGDKVWVKITGTREELSNIIKQDVLDSIKTTVGELKLELIPLDVIKSNINDQYLKPEVLFDSIIANNATSDYAKYLQNYWREVINS